MLKKIKKHLKNQKGFTLIELLAVIVILGIIAAIAVPAIGGIINKSEKDAVVAEGIQIINAAKLYVTSENPGAVTIDKDELGSYLDNVKDGDYEVVLTKDATSGKYSYTLSNHNSAQYVGDKNPTATEAELLAY